MVCLWDRYYLHLTDGIWGIPEVTKKLLSWDTILIRWFPFTQPSCLLGICVWHLRHTKQTADSSVNPSTAAQRSCQRLLCAVISWASLQRAHQCFVFDRSKRGNPKECYPCRELPEAGMKSVLSWTNSHNFRIKLRWFSPPRRIPSEESPWRNMCWCLPLGWRSGGIRMPGVKHLWKHKGLDPRTCLNGAEAVTQAGSKAQAWRQAQTLLLVFGSKA